MKYRGRNDETWIKSEERKERTERQDDPEYSGDEVNKIDCIGHVSKQKLKSKVVIKKYNNYNINGCFNLVLWTKNPRSMEIIDKNWPLFRVYLYTSEDIVHSRVF